MQLDLENRVRLNITSLSYRLLYSRDMKAWLKLLSWASSTLWLVVKGKGIEKFVEFMHIFQVTSSSNSTVW